MEYCGKHRIGGQNWGDRGRLWVRWLQNRESFVGESVRGTSMRGTSARWVGFGMTDSGEGCRVGSEAPYDCGIAVITVDARRKFGSGAAVRCMGSGVAAGVDSTLLP